MYCYVCAPMPLLDNVNVLFRFSSKGTSKLVHGVISNKQCRKKPLTNKAMPMKKKPGTTLGNKVGKSQRLENDRCSFAPSNFVFTAPVGVQSYPLKQDSAITDALPSKIRLLYRKSKFQFYDIIVIVFGCLLNETIVFRTPSDKRNGENMTRKIRNDDFKSPIPKTLTDEQFSPLLDICPWITRTRGSSSRKKLKQIAECKLEDASEAKLSLVEEFNAIEQSETGQTGLLNLFCRHTLTVTVALNIADASR